MPQIPLQSNNSSSNGQSAQKSQFKGMLRILLFGGLGVLAFFFAVTYLPLILIFGDIQGKVKTHIGGDYYKGLTGIFVQRCESGGLFGCTYSYERVLGADKSTFTVLDDGYAKDTHGIYCEQRLEGITEANFRKIGMHFYQTGTQIRNRCQLVKRDNDGSISDFDVQTFENLGCNYVRDMTGVYGPGKIEVPSEHVKGMRYARGVGSYSKVSLFDTNSLRVLVTGEENGCVFQDKTITLRVSEELGNGALQPYVVEANLGVSSFDLGCGFKRIENTVYYLNEKLETVNPFSFRTYLGRDYNDCVYGYYATDGVNVFYQSNKILLADVSTFEVLDTIYPYDIAKDKNRYYSSGRTDENGIDSGRIITAKKNKEYQESMAPYIIATKDRITIDLARCAKDTQDIYSSGWSLGGHSITVVGLEEGNCAIWLPTTERDTMSTRYICRVPISLGKATFKYDISAIDTASISYSFDRSAYCAKEFY